MIVALGSTNGPKAEAVRLALTAIWPDRSFELRSHRIPSGVSEQPLDTDETILGAQNRARGALAAEPTADLAVGIEGGLCPSPVGMMESTWVCIISPNGREGYGTSLRMPLPPSFQEHIDSGGDLTEAADAAFGTTNTGEGGGFFGSMTNGAITRASAYRDAVCAALAPHVHPHLFPLDVGATAGAL